MKIHDEHVTTAGVIGLGVVGGTLARALGDAGIAVRGYDSYQGVGRPDDLQDCPVVFLCVPTPSMEDGGYDLAEVWNALRTLEPHLGAGTVVVVKSTVPPGTSDRLSVAFPGLTFASMPEFLVASRPMETLTRPDRVVIGCRSPRTARMLADLIGKIAPSAPVVHLRPTEAELVKLASNAMLSAKVSMANELAEVCGPFGVAWSRVQAGVGLDRRIGPDHLTVTPDRGFGGTCLPKDLDGLIAASAGAGYRPPVLEEIAAFNRNIRGAAALRSVS
jgi:UDPglucose 6-dehydrogenase